MFAPLIASKAILKTQISVTELGMNQILIASISVDLPTIESVMVTFADMDSPPTCPKAKQTREVCDSSASKPTSPMTPPAQIQRSSLKIRVLKMDSMSNDKKAKTAEETPDDVISPEALLYPMVAFSANKSRQAKSEILKQKLAFPSGYVLAKESKSKENGKAPRQKEESEKPYTGPITLERAKQMKHSSSGISEVLDGLSIESHQPRCMSSNLTSDSFFPTYLTPSHSCRAPRYQGLLVSPQLTSQSILGGSIKGNGLELT